MDLIEQSIRGAFDEKSTHAGDLDETLVKVIGPIEEASLRCKSVRSVWWRSLLGEASVEKTGRMSNVSG